ncbi:hypothetical protein IWW38_002806 [Coemansia aciculifera]|uniref:Uncharacterized protein n=1 Tax=Coemansia aciculifera TaxID=417176 RepID=A0ACC1M381_9FUNG|nr:hypothetical protein IWW38_002806 [Coemansia aciculifera]
MASPAEQSVATDEYGDEFIKETDDAQINRQMGVGACALHPCLTRRGTTTLNELDNDDDEGERELVGLLEKHCKIEKEKRGKSTHSHSAGQIPMTPPHRALSTKRGSGSARVSALSDSNAASALSVTPASVSAGQARLSQKRLELTMAAGLRYSESATNIKPSRTGAETPTVDLVQTAVSVREVSKLIGRTVVQVSNVRRIMIVTKPNDTSLVRLTRDLAIWLMEHPSDEGRQQLQTQPMVVYVEEAIARHSNFNLARVRSKCPAAQTALQQWTPELCASSPELFDFVVTLGGDGTVLYTSWLFQKTVPPIIPFHLGSLGFLTVFDHRHARRVLDSAIRAGVRINLRMRFTCTVYRLAEAVDPQHANVLVDAADCNRVIDHALATNGLQSCDEHPSSGKSTRKHHHSHRTTTPSEADPVIIESEWDDVPLSYQQRVRKVWKRDSTFQVMNEVVVDRGPSPYLTQIELYGDGNHLTTVEADGLCLATPTGSTAYSLAAGGSLVHPEIPAILVTPICAHTLSFRPMLLPDSMVVRVVLPPDSRNTAWASFDGRHRIELKRGDHIQITASKYPLPTVCASQSQTQDWMSSLARCLNWNERKRQKKFGDVVAISAVSGGGASDDDGGDEGGEDDDDALSF